MAIEECPRSSETTFRGTPLVNMTLAAECRRVCNPAPGIPARAAAALNARRALRGSQYTAIRFSPQFKAEAVQMVLETGKPVAEVARDLGINEGTLGNWVNIWRRDNPEPVPDLNPVERARVKEMEDEIRRLRMENEFLKKAAAFFARTQP